MAEAPQEMSEALQQRYGDEMHFSLSGPRPHVVRQPRRLSRQSRATAFQSERHHLGFPSGRGAP